MYIDSLALSLQLCVCVPGQDYVSRPNDDNNKATQMGRSEAQPNNPKSEQQIHSKPLEIHEYEIVHKTYTHIHTIYYTLYI